MISNLPSVSYFGCTKEIYIQSIEDKEIPKSVSFRGILNGKILFCVHLIVHRFFAVHVTIALFPLPFAFCARSLLY